MSLAGDHQLQNAATALTAFFALRDTGALLQATSADVLKGLERASLPGRFQVSSLQPYCFTYCFTTSALRVTCQRA